MSAAVSTDPKQARPPVKRIQARSLDPSAAVPKAPSPIGYARFQKLAHTVRDRLIQRGHAPADLIDVRGFIWETLRPRGVQTLDQIRL